MDRLTFDALPGVRVAHVTDLRAGTGCTVVVCPDGATGGVDVAGGAPATRETDLLRPEEMVQKAHAVVLSGGSAFGLAAASGVADELERQGIGLDVGVTRVPIVCSACLFDLAIGDPRVRPGEAAGAQAVRQALRSGYEAPREQGNVGAGAGATVGKFAGPLQVMKGGLGWDVEKDGPLVVGAVAAVNAVGSVLDPATGQMVAGARTAPGSRELIADPLGFIAAGLGAGGAPEMPLARTNTTVSCVVTNALLTKAQATKVAQMCGDAYARTIVPAHTTNDGDTVFVLATGDVEVPEDAVGVVAQRVVARAIVAGCAEAESLLGVPGAKTWKRGQE